LSVKPVEQCDDLAVKGFKATENAAKVFREFRMIHVGVEIAFCGFVRDFAFALRAIVVHDGQRNFDNTRGNAPSVLLPLSLNVVVMDAVSLGQAFGCLWEQIVVLTPNVAVFSEAVLAVVIPVVERRVKSFHELFAGNRDADLVGG
jgi:hypothetical protein